MILNLAVLSSVGFILDLFFAHSFFIFPDPNATLGKKINGIPIEEFIFYITGFWFILAFYIFNDEYFLSRYNVPDSRYLRYARRLRRKVYLNISVRSFFILITLCSGSIILKYLLNRAPGNPLPGYFIFLSIAAYIPWILFWRVSRMFVNTRALIFTILTTLCISIIWEVTLALPKGYWNYNSKEMVGIFINFWSNLPFEAVTVWIFSSLIILCYEYTKLQLYRFRAKRAKLEKYFKERQIEPVSNVR